MRAVVLEQPGPPESMRISLVDRPEPEPGWVRIKVEAFGLNRSEYHLRAGMAANAVFPIIPGIEATGTVDAAPGGEFAVGQQVVAMMGGMGRQFDGGYAEYTVVPRDQVVPFTSDLPWHVIGAVPETLQTAYGSLATGLDLSEGQTLLVRGGTSSVGLAAITVAKDRNAIVVATTRRPERTQALLDHGADHVVVDDGEIAGQVRALLGGGVDAALELVGTPTLPDTLRATRVHGTVCFTGMLSNQWTVPDFYPIDYLPRGVRLTAYGGDSTDLPPTVLQGYLDRLAAGTASLGPIKVHQLEDIREAHTDLEDNRTFGKHVVLTDAGRPA
jgi:NADPH:quinone reductase-like Zn-dependent oxidoreductase